MLAALPGDTNSLVTEMDRDIKYLTKQYSENTHLHTSLTIDGGLYLAWRSPMKTIHAYI